MINFTIAVTNFDDAMVMEQWGIVNAHMTFADEVVKNGGKVIFQMDFENAPSEVLMVISTQQDLEQWKLRVSKVIELLKKRD